MTFCSILFENVQDRPHDSTNAPDYFADLNCDQIVDAITAGKEQYNLKPFFYSCLRSAEAIAYRHSVMKDIENPSLLECVNAFAKKMCDMRQFMAGVNKIHYKEYRQGWFLDAVENYCESVSSFFYDLSKIELRSAGFIGFRSYLSHYVSSPDFQSLWRKTREIKNDLSTIRYCVRIKGDKVTVRHHDFESDYSIEIEETFEKFAQGEVKDYRVRFKTTDDMNHIKAKILEFVAKLHPQIFSDLDDYCARHAAFMDKTIADFDRAIQFYVSYLDHIRSLERADLQFCYPRMSDQKTDIYSYAGFDIALAHKLVKENSPVVCNDFYLTGGERVLVVSGPNQGGKTTFARTFGQLHYLAKIGCPVPGRAAQLFLFDNLFTQFERQEKVENLRGKLEDDLIRIHRIVEQATPRSIIIMNEVFTSTTLQDEIFLSTKLMQRVIALDLLCVWVTFVDELASFGPQTVSMVSTIVPDNPALRTFKIVRRPADGLAYAMAIAHKHRLTYDAIKDRIKP
jgi:DNA mismatch repair protein MutS